MIARKVSAVNEDVGNQITPQALAALEAELHELETDGRREMAERLRTARAWGDLSENAEYHDAKNAQAHLETKILRLQDLRRNAVVVEPGATGGAAGLGRRGHGARPRLRSRGDPRAGRARRSRTRPTAGSASTRRSGARSRARARATRSSSRRRAGAAAWRSSRSTNPERQSAPGSSSPRRDVPAGEPARSAQHRAHLGSRRHRVVRAGDVQRRLVERPDQHVRERADGLLA